MHQPRESTYNAACTQTKPMGVERVVGEPGIDAAGSPGYHLPANVRTKAATKTQPGADMGMPNVLSGGHIAKSSSSPT